MNLAGVWLLESAALAAPSEMPPPPFSYPGNVHRDGADPHGLWLCSVDETPWITTQSRIIQPQYSAKV